MMRRDPAPFTAAWLSWVLVIHNPVGNVSLCCWQLGFLADEPDQP